MCGYLQKCNMRHHGLRPAFVGDGETLPVVPLGIALLISIIFTGYIPLLNGREAPILGYTLWIAVTLSTVGLPTLLGYRDHGLLLCCIAVGIVWFGILSGIAIGGAFFGPATTTLGVVEAGASGAIQAGPVAGSVGYLLGTVVRVVQNGSFEERGERLRLTVGVISVPLTITTLLLVGYPSFLS